MDEINVHVSVFVEPATPVLVSLGHANGGGVLRIGEGGVLGIDVYLGLNDADALTVLDTLTDRLGRLRALIHARMTAPALAEVGP